MKAFRYQADRLPITLIILLFLADLWVYFQVRNFSLLIAWVCVGLVAKIFIAAWNHHHQHVHTFRQTILNRLLEVVYTFHTGISTNVWVLHHNLGHHLHYLDQGKDESGWRRKDGTMMGPLEYTFTIAITGYSRALRVCRDHPKFQKDLNNMGLVNIFFIALLVWHNPKNATFVFLIPMTLIYLGTCWNTYYHHAGLDTDNHMHASHNVTNRLYNIVSGNLGLHTAHHMKQGLHWSELPALHRMIEKQIPPELIHKEFPVVGTYYRKFVGQMSRTEMDRAAR